MMMWSLYVRGTTHNILSHFLRSTLISTPGISRSTQRTFILRVAYDPSHAGRHVI